ncbi:hypothetical protein GCM10025759_10280 [Lysobacter panacisoli]|uniref:Uncharacterized protein n=1 Tax=Lysobacter panacisoli TaxID=1255263 RepID=A0ABP9L564_9GAMM
MEPRQSRRGRREWPGAVDDAPFAADDPPVLFSCQCSDLLAALMSKEIDVPGLARMPVDDNTAPNDVAQRKA